MGQMNIVQRDLGGRERAVAAEKLQAGTSYPIMWASRMYGLPSELAYTIYDSAKQGMAGFEPVTSRAQREWASREAHELNPRGAIDFYWWACSHLASKRRGEVLNRLGDL